jgi:myotubularin-related protein 6/7/8
MFELESEFARMGIPNNQWSLTHLNSNYEMCDTYPNVLYVPTIASPQLIQGSASFRSRGRLPVLSYLHSNNASISRCSQPLTGFNGRCIEDENYLQTILKTNDNSSFMYIVDTRPQINAVVNKAQGKGFENENNYKNIKFQFFGIENIHVMRSSLKKLTECSEIVNPITTPFSSGLEKSEWLKHIKAVIDTSIFIVEAISIENANVLVHCSDGWDRTAQTCALSSFLLDPYYRTIHGFQILIEKGTILFIIEIKLH